MPTSIPASSYTSDGDAETVPLSWLLHRPALEVADVFRNHGDAFLDLYGDVLSPEQRRALSDIAACRTAALGGHVEECDQCGHRQIAYNSCRDRHCPKCQAAATAEWLERERRHENLASARDLDTKGTPMLRHYRRMLDEWKRRTRSGPLDRADILAILETKKK